MAHVHHCAVCRVAVAACSDSACESPEHANAGEHYCSIHHPDPEHKVPVIPPAPRYSVIAHVQLPAEVKE